MNKEILDWTISDLQKNAHLIEFGEYQREPSVWDLKAKRRLIDSILRSYDISSIYLYRKEDERYECVDGRQRINAILSFLGTNIADDGGQLHNHFVFQSTDELLGTSQLQEFEGKRFKELHENEQGDFFSPVQQDLFLEYRPTIVLITELNSENDLHLMFLRLQLGAPLNAGEKLNAMRGDMRNFIFDELGSHPYFERLKIPQRRFSKEQTAAQVALQYFSLKEKGTFRKARFDDLQTFFKEKSSMTPSEKEMFDDLRSSLDRATKLIEEKGRKIELKNRAMGVSIYFILRGLSDADAVSFFEFLEEFQDTVKEQLKRGVLIERKYLSLLKFQTYITQAAVEKYAIEGRHDMLLDYFKHFVETREIKEDPVA